MANSSVNDSSSIQLSLSTNRSLKMAT
jgi:hypothetical protein